MILNYINQKKKAGNFTNMWRLNNMLLNDCFEKKIKRQISNLKKNKSTNITYQNLQNADEAVLRGKFIAMKAYVKKDKILNK